MSISQIAPTKPDAEYSLAAVSTWANTNAFGRDRCSLTEWDTTTVPALAEGSIFETGGAYYQVDSDTAITVGAVSDGFVFILVNTSTPAVPTLQFTNSIPVWDASKFGYYDTATNYKALPFIMLKATASYTMKGHYDPYGYFLPTSIPMFQAYRTSDYTFTGGLSTSLEITNIWTGTNYNFDSCFNTTTGRFTAPYSGVYNISTNNYFETAGSANMRIIKNSTNELNHVASSGSPTQPPVASNVYLNNGDYISLWHYYTSTNTNWRSISGSCDILFSVRKVG